MYTVEQHRSIAVALAKRGDYGRAAGHLLTVYELTGLSFLRQIRELDPELSEAHRQALADAGPALARFARVRHVPPPPDTPEQRAARGAERQAKTEAAKRVERVRKRAWRARQRPRPLGALALKRLGAARRAQRVIERKRKKETGHEQEDRQTQGD